MKIEESLPSYSDLVNKGCSSTSDASATDSLPTFTQASAASSDMEVLADSFSASSADPMASEERNAIMRHEYSSPTLATDQRSSTSEIGEITLPSSTRAALPVTPLKRSPMPSPGLSGLRSASYSLIPSPMSKAQVNISRTHSGNVSNNAFAGKGYPDHQAASSDVGSDNEKSPTTKDKSVVGTNSRQPSSRSTSQQDNSTLHDRADEDMSQRRVSQTLISRWEESLRSKDVKLDEAYHRVSQLQNQIDNMMLQMQENEECRAQAERETEQMTRERDELSKGLRRHEEELLQRDRVIEEQTESLNLKGTSQALIESKLMKDIEELNEQKRILEHGESQRKLTIAELHRRISNLCIELEQKSQELTKTREERDSALDDSVTQLDLASERQQLFLEIEELRQQLDAKESMINDMHEADHAVGAEGVSLFEELDRDDASSNSEESDLDQNWPVHEADALPKSPPTDNEQLFLHDTGSSHISQPTTQQTDTFSTQELAIKSNQKAATADGSHTVDVLDNVQAISHDSTSTKSHRPTGVSWATATEPSLHNVPHLTTSASSPVSLDSPDKIAHRGRQLKSQLGWPPVRAVSSHHQRDLKQREANVEFEPVFSNHVEDHLLSEPRDTESSTKGETPSAKQQNILYRESEAMIEAKRRDTMKWTEAQQAEDHPLVVDFPRPPIGRVQDRYRKFGQRCYSDDITWINNRPNFNEGNKHRKSAHDLRAEIGSHTREAKPIYDENALDAVALAETYEAPLIAHTEPVGLVWPLKPHTARHHHLLLIIAWTILVLSVIWTMLGPGEGAFGTGGYAVDIWLTRRAQSTRDWMREWLQVRPDIVT